MPTGLGLEWNDQKRPKSSKPILRALCFSPLAWGLVVDRIKGSGSWTPSTTSSPLLSSAEQQVESTGDKGIARIEYKLYKNDYYPGLMHHLSFDQQLSFCMIAQGGLSTEQLDLDLSERANVSELPSGKHTLVQLDIKPFFAISLTSAGWSPRQSLFAEGLYFHCTLPKNTSWTLSIVSGVNGKALLLFYVDSESSVQVKGDDFIRVLQSMDVPIGTFYHHASSHSTSLSSMSLLPGDGTIVAYQIIQHLRDI